MARREKGTGSISQRKDGTWTGRVCLGYQSNGNQRIKAIYGKTEAEVKKKLKALQKDLIRFEPQESTKLTFGELLEDWLYNIKFQELKPSSFDRTELTVKQHIIPYIGFMPVQSISMQDIQQFVNQLTTKGLSYSSIKKAYNAVNAALKIAVERDYIRKNPCVHISLPKQAQKAKSDIEYFNDEEVEIICREAIKKYSTGKYIYKHGYALIILLNTGMRVGELLALKWHNVDLDKNQLYISETRGQIKDRTDSPQSYMTVDRSTKTSCSERYVPINKQTREALVYFKGLGYNNPYVMANSDKGVITYRNLFRILDNILTKNNIDHGSIHSLRHTFATRLFKNNVDVKVISELLGHSDISITYDIYTHVINEQKQKAVDILDNL